MLWKKPAYYGRVERGEANISLELLLLVAVTLGAPLSGLLDLGPEKDRNAISRELSSLLENATDDELQLVYRVVRDLLV